MRDTYKLKSGADELEADHCYADQFFAHTPNAGNDRYKLKDFSVENNEILAKVVRFMNPKLMPDHPSQVCIEVETMVIRAYLGLCSVNWVKVLKDLVMRFAGGIYNSRVCPMTPFAMHIYHHLDLLMEEEKVLYINTNRDWEYNFVNEPTVASGTQKGGEGETHRRR